nr:hypothetical protein [Burkholderia ubonensis]
MEQPTSIRSTTRSHARFEDSWDRISQWTFLLVPLVFIGFCVILISLWYVDILTGWLIVAFVLLIEAMLLGIGFFVFMMVRMSRRRGRRHDARTASCHSNQPDDADLPLPVGFDGVKTVECVFKSRQMGTFRVSCYNTNCPFMHGADEAERSSRQAGQAYSSEALPCESESKLKE